MKKKFTEEPLGDFTQDSSLLSSAKVEGIASIITTLGYSLSTLATILALEEAEEAIQLESEKSQDQSKQFKQMYTLLQHINNRLDSIERKLDRY